MGVILGSARVSRAGDGVLAIANFSYVFDQPSHEAPRKFVSARRRFGCAQDEAALQAAIIRATYGLGGGVGRGLGVVWGLGVGVGLGVAVGLPEAVAVAVGDGGG